MKFFFSLIFVNFDDRMVKKVLGRAGCHWGVGYERCLVVLLFVTIGYKNAVCLTKSDKKMSFRFLKLVNDVKIWVENFLFVFVCSLFIYTQSSIVRFQLHGNLGILETCPL